MATHSAKKTPATRAGRTAAELEAERLAALRAAKRDEDEADGKEKDEDGDEERDDVDADGEGSGAKDDDAEDVREGDADEDDGKDDGEDADKKDEARGAAAAAKRAAEAAVKAERVRISKITEIARQFDMPRLGERHIGRDTSVRAFKDLVLERLAKKQAERGNPTFAANSDDDVSRERGSRAPGSVQREMAEGEAHWRRVAGKPA